MLDECCCCLFNPGSFKFICPIESETRCGGPCLLKIVVDVVSVVVVVNVAVNIVVVIVVCSMSVQIVFLFSLHFKNKLIISNRHFIPVAIIN